MKPKFETIETGYCPRARADYNGGRGPGERASESSARNGVIIEEVIGEVKSTHRNLLVVVSSIEQASLLQKMLRRKDRDINSVILSPSVMETEDLDNHLGAVQEGAFKVIFIHHMMVLRAMPFLLGKIRTIFSLTRSTQLFCTYILIASYGWDGEDEESQPVMRCLVDQGWYGEIMKKEISEWEAGVRACDIPMIE